MQRPITLLFLQLTSLSSLEEIISINTRTLLLEMGHNQTVTLGTREVVMLRAFTTNLSNRIPITGCFSGLLSQRYYKEYLIHTNVQVQSFYLLHVYINSIPSKRDEDICKFCHCDRITLFVFPFILHIHKLYRIIVIFN